MLEHPTALVPLRALGTGKSRLAGVLGAEQRASLAAAMAADVLEALAASQVAEVVVVAGDRSAARFARARGVDAVVDPAGTSGLDAALSAAAHAVGPRDTLLVVAADLPTVHGHEIDRVVERDSHVVVAPTRDGGTGALLRRPGTAIATAYGPDSAARHLHLAEQAGVGHSSIDLAGLRHDVDTWDDLVALTDLAVGSCTAAVLADLLGGVPSPSR